MRQGIDTKTLGAVPLPGEAEQRRPTVEGQAQGNGPRQPQQRAIDGAKPDLRGPEMKDETVGADDQRRHDDQDEREPVENDYQPSHRSLELGHCGGEWTRQGSNLRPRACEARALTN